MNLSQGALKALQTMRGEEGGVFMRDLPINCYPSQPPEKRCQIPWEKVVSPEVFEELKKAGAIELHIEGSDWDQWAMTPAGLKALQDAGMNTKEGKLSRDDIQWLAGTGYYAQ
ncbi:MAG TPA: hypothetical protein VJ046_02835 [Candidatus Paceibacterota bacterium]|nr:hypothetical protein [Candidatus Paceibacterota bacterium]